MKYVYGIVECSQRYAMPATVGSFDAGLSRSLPPAATCRRLICGMPSKAFETS